jgi:hypothetical protein
MEALGTGVDRPQKTERFSARALRATSRILPVINVTVEASPDCYG